MWLIVRNKINKKVSNIIYVLIFKKNNFKYIFMDLRSNYFEYKKICRFVDIKIFLFFGIIIVLIIDIFFLDMVFFMLF